MDRVVTVTGASRTIGRGTAIRLARDSSAVALVARTRAAHPFRRASPLSRIFAMVLMLASANMPSRAAAIKSATDADAATIEAAKTHSTVMPRSDMMTGNARAGTAATAPLPSTQATTTFHKIDVRGVGIFYREAGPKDAPTIVLLHGFPSSSRGFNTLIPLLATRYHVVAPDFPSFGQSDTPSPEAYHYTFDHLAETTAALLDQLKIDRYTLYLFDYGAPVGYRIILANPERLHALIIQNGNAYKEGLGPKWAKIAEFWADPKAHPKVVDAFLSYEATKQRHLAGTSRPDAYDPDSWTDEFAHLSQPGQREIQAALLYDYQTNVASYPAWQACLRQYKPPTLVAWGANDPSFIAAGGDAYRRDLPDAEIHLLDSGHFALDEKNDEIARLILDFMARHPG